MAVELNLMFDGTLELFLMGIRCIMKMEMRLEVCFVRCCMNPDGHIVDKVYK